MPPLLSLLALASVALGTSSDSSNSISRPSVDESFFLLGKFDAFSNYDNLAKYNLSNPLSSGLYRLNSSTLSTTDSTKGSISLLQADPFNGSSPSALYNIDNTSVLALVGGKPYLYDTSSNTASILENWDGVSGNVTTAHLVSNSSLLYLGGDFQYKNSTAAVAYNLDTKQIKELPFEGFNEGSQVNVITAYEDSVIFGGNFRSLGNATLAEVMYNSTASNSTRTKSSNSTGSSSSTEPEQQINLGLAQISTANTADGSDPQSILCPSDSGSSWTMSSDQNGGSWSAQLPFSITPSKIRLYNGNSDGNGVRMFRIITSPASSIMNLSYIDPVSHELTSCDAWCPLYDDSTLESSISNSSYSIGGTYQVTTAPGVRGTLGYGTNYQEFEFANTVPLNAITVLVLDHYGKVGVLNGLQLYQYGMRIYADDSYNSDMCSNGNSSSSSQETISSSNSQSLGGISWNSNGGDLSTSIQSSDIKRGTQGIRYNANIAATGNYSFLLYTGGCGADGTCSQRGVVNATVYAGNGTSLASKLVYQTNTDLKYDEIFTGDIYQQTGAGSPYMTVTMYSGLGSDNVTFVADYMVVQYNSIDYNATTSGIVSLNGLFEYAPANFTSSSIKSPVGNTTLNLLGSTKLSKKATVNGLEVLNSTLYVAGEFNSTYGDNFVAADLKGYEKSTNEIELKASSATKGGLNGAVSGLAAADQKILLWGPFQGNANSSDATLNGAAIYDGSYQGISAGSVNSASTFKYNGTDYAVFNQSTGSSVYALSNSKQLNSSSLLNLNVTQGGDSIAYGEITAFDKLADDAVLVGNGSLNSFSSISRAYSPVGSVNSGLYLNESAMVVGGNDVVVISGSKSSSLVDNLSFGKNTTVGSLYSYKDTLFMGLNGTSSYDGKSSSGLLVYDLKKKSVTLPSSLESGAVVNAFELDPESSGVVVGGKFSASQCNNLCLYNVSTNSLSAALSDSSSLSGEVSDLSFYNGSLALVGGDLNVKSSAGFLAVYDSKQKSISIADKLNKQVPGPVKKLLLPNGNKTTGLDDSILVMGSSYVGYLKDYKYTSLMDGISNDTAVFTDVALVNGSGNFENLGSKKTLVLTGLFNLTEYGRVSSAIHDGKSWYPLMITGYNLSSSDAIVNAVVPTSKSYASTFNTTEPSVPSSSGPSNVQKGVRYLTKGQITGVGCALAVGTTMLLTALGGLAYLFLKKDTVVAPLKSRVGEATMVSAVPPGEVMDNMNRAKVGEM